MAEAHGLAPRLRAVLHRVADRVRCAVGAAVRQRGAPPGRRGAGSRPVPRASGVVRGPRLRRAGGAQLLAFPAPVGRPLRIPLRGRRPLVVGAARCRAAQIRLRWLPGDRPVLRLLPGEPTLAGAAGWEVEAVWPFHLYPLREAPAADGSTAGGIPQGGWRSAGPARSRLQLQDWPRFAAAGSIFVFLPVRSREGEGPPVPGGDLLAEIGWEREG